MSWMSEPQSSVGFLQDVLLRNRSCETHCSWRRSMAPPHESLLCAFWGGFLGSRRLLAEMLLHVDIHLAWNLEGGLKLEGIFPFLHWCMKPWCIMLFIIIFQHSNMYTCTLCFSFVVLHILHFCITLNLYLNSV